MPKVLVVDDDEGVRHYVAAVLEHHSIEVGQESDGMAALERLSSEGFDLVITDCNMPRMNGIGLIQNLRIRQNAIPVIMFSSEDPAIVRKALGCNTPFILNKPASVSLLAATTLSLLHASPVAPI